MQVIIYTGGEISNIEMSSEKVHMYLTNIFLKVTCKKKFF